MLSINTNINNLKLQRHLNSVSAKTQTAMERMSTGYRINNASDDAAGLVISKALKVQENGLTIANDNAQMATSILNVADGALSKMADLTLRIRDLALQSTNGSYSDIERAALNQEAQQLTKNIEQLIAGTNFNNFYIFDEQQATTPAVVNEPTPLNLDPDTVYVENAQQLYEALNDANALNNANYKIELTNNIDLNDLDDLDGNGSNWVTIGTSSNAFKGTLDGNGYTISNLKINTTEAYQGLFGYTDGATIQNVKLDNVDIATNANFVGALVGCGDGSEFVNCISSGTISGNGAVGGLVGRGDNSTFTNCDSRGIVSASMVSAGGLVGQTDYGNFTCCSSSVDVAGANVCNSTGGLVGSGKYSTLTNCYSTGSVTGIYYIAGLVGNADYINIQNCYSTGNVEGWSHVGGLVGDGNHATIENSFSTGNISLSDESNEAAISFGGFVGDGRQITITNCYSTGQIETAGITSGVGGLVGLNTGATVTNCSYAEQANGYEGLGTGQASTWFNDVQNIKSVLGDDGTWDYSTFSGGSPHLASENTQGNSLIFQIGTEANELSTIRVATSFDLGDFYVNISNSDFARFAITKCDEFLNRISKKQAELGASSNIMSSITQGNSITKENLSASNSRITDADIAKESANMVKNQILQNTATALLAQSQNIDGGLLLRLLGGI